jgi:uncharacterized protein GlcG (DUF336 family)
MKALSRSLILGVATAAVLLGPWSVQDASATSGGCPVTHRELQISLKKVVANTSVPDDFGLPMWAVVVNRGGVVCAVAFSGSGLFDQWLLSRQIAAAKAFTTNGLSTSVGQALTTAALDPLVQPGGPLFGLAAGNPSDPAKIYKGPQSKWGTADDPMVGQIVGGTITFGGGTPLDKNGKIVGGVGVSGDTAARDQAVSDALAADLGL